MKILLSALSLSITRESLLFYCDSFFSLSCTFSSNFWGLIAAVTLGVQVCDLEAHTLAQNSHTDTHAHTRTHAHSYTLTFRVEDLLLLFDKLLSFTFIYIHSFTCSVADLNAHLFIHILVCSLIHLLTHPPAHLVFHLITHSPTHLLTHLLTHSPTH